MKKIVTKALCSLMAAVMCAANVCSGDSQPLTGNSITGEAVSVDPINGYVSDPMTYESLKYVKADKDGDGTYDCIWISGFDDSSISSVDIPSKIDGLPVTDISAYAFFNTGITRVTIPSSVLEIGQFAFGRCYRLSRVTIENPNCKIYDVRSTIFNDYGVYNGYQDYKYNGVIRGYRGSTADLYAFKHGYDFEAIRESSTEPPTTAPPITTKPTTTTLLITTKPTTTTPMITTKPTTTAPPITTKPQVQGDLSGDGTIDFLDLVNLSKLLLPGAKISDEQLAIADLNGNGKLDFLDLVALSKELLKNANK